LADGGSARTNRRVARTYFTVRLIAHCVLLRCALARCTFLLCDLDVWDMTAQNSSKSRALIGRIEHHGSPNLISPPDGPASLRLAHSAAFDRRAWCPMQEFLFLDEITIVRRTGHGLAKTTVISALQGWRVTMAFWNNPPSHPIVCRCANWDARTLQNPSCPLPRRDCGLPSYCTCFPNRSCGLLVC
jgi:hypothetical protein